MSAGGWVIFWAVVAVVVIAEFVRESKSKNSDIWDAGGERRRKDRGGGDGGGDSGCGGGDGGGDSGCGGGCGGGH
ncbi:MAG: hypothetical protein QOG37_478 [Mycobacterium sp.]|nr:hypothetical protein [Mycobacterium sp.]